MNDLRHSLRQPPRSPGFTAMVVATLALSVSGNAAVYTSTENLILRPLLAVIVGAGVLVMADIANLLCARATTRQSEIAIRLAMGPAGCALPMNAKRSARHDFSRFLFER